MGFSFCDFVCIHANSVLCSHVQHLTVTNSLDWPLDWNSLFLIIILFNVENKKSKEFVFADLAKSSINNYLDDDFCDVGVSNNSDEHSSRNDNLAHNAFKTNWNGRGVDRQWKLLNTFENSEDYHSSDVFKRINV